MSKLQSRAFKSYSERTQNAKNTIEIRVLLCIDNACYIVEKPLADKIRQKSVQHITFPFYSGKLNVDLDKINLLTDLDRDENIYIICQL